MSRLSPFQISLRRTVLADLPMLHSFELDEASNQRACTKPRDWDTFHQRWKEILADQDGGVLRVTPRVILADGELVGSINISPHEGLATIGYWIARNQWGRGLASHAVALMLNAFTPRPLYATVAASNQPSLRVLAKHGFTVLTHGMTPETARTIARETVTLVLWE